MDNDNLLIICRSCGRKVLMHNMRPAADGENMICIDCYKKSSGVSSKGIFGKSEEPATTGLGTSRAASEKKEKMIKYICTNCKYKFSRKESQHVSKCPYCGKNSIVVDNALGADKLINDALDKKYDW